MLALFVISIALLGIFCAVSISQLVDLAKSSFGFLIGLLFLALAYGILVITLAILYSKYVS